jgi:DNA-binding NtrC family response regulator
MNHRLRIFRHLPLFDGPFSVAPDLRRSRRNNLVNTIYPPRILLVDDDEATLLGLSDALRLRLGKVMLDTATSGDLAIEHLASEAHDLIISDILMPGTDGVLFLKEAQRLRPGVPVILVTGHPDREEAALYGGAYAFLEKPLNMPPFISVVRAALDRSRLQRRAPERHQASLLDERMALFPPPLSTS